MVCKNCNAEIKDHSRFCPYCGAKNMDEELSKEFQNACAEREKAIRIAEQSVNALTIARDKEISLIRQNYWRPLYQNVLQYCPAEGKLFINGMIYPYSFICGAQVNTTRSERYVVEEKGKTKHSPSLGKAIVGGAVFGPVGAIVGGVSGKSKTNSVSTQNTIPICTHMGIQINVNGFVQEVTIFDGSMDLNNRRFAQLLNEANSIVSFVSQLSHAIVPKKVLPIEQYPSVLDYDRQIDEARKRLDNIKSISVLETLSEPEKMIEDKI